MGKKKQLMAALNSMGSAYMRALVALSNQRERHDAIVDAMTNGMRRLTEERDAALEDAAEQIAEKKRHNMIVDAMAEGVNRVVGERDAALADVETLTEANSKSDATIGELRDDLADTRERLDAALTEAARMRKEWANDASVAREIIARKTDENIKLRRDAADLRDELEALHANCGAQVAELQEHANQWDALCFRLGIAQASHIDAVIAAAQAQAAPAVDQDLKR